MEDVTGAVFVAVVATEVDATIGLREIPSKPLTELGGLEAVVTESSERRDNLTVAESRRSLDDLLTGGGMLILARSIVAFVCSDCAKVLFRAGKSNGLVAARRE